MLRVQTTQAEVGMRLAMPVFHPEHAETILLRAGYTIDERGMERIKQLRIPEFWIEYPGLDFIAKHLSLEVLQARGAVSYVIDQLFERLAQDTQTPLQFATFKNAATSLTEKLVNHPAAARHLHDIAEGNDAQTRHASEVAFLALLMGLKLEWYLIEQRRQLSGRRAKDVVNLGVAGMLHDIGMLFLDEDVLERWNASHDESDRQWQRHVNIGARKVRGTIDATAVAAILHHHQHFDASGFPQRETPDAEPRGLEGEEIHIFARIIGAADLYDRLRHPPASATALPGVMALSALRKPPYRDWIDPVIFRALLAVAPPYPPGSVVTLSDGTRCVVIDNDEEHPCRPIVRPLPEGLRPDETRRQCDSPEPFSLLERTGLFIREIDGCDVGDANFEASCEGEFLCLSPTEQSLRRGRLIDERNRAA